MDTAPLLDSTSSPNSPRIVRAMLAAHPATEGIEIVVWPDEDERRRSLATAGSPTLLLVPADADAPDCAFLEEWARLPAPMDDVYARLDMLRDRTSCVSVPVLRPGGVLAFGSDQLVIPTGQLPLVKVLIEHFRMVVHREVLADAYEAAGGTPTDEALKAAMFRVGRRIAPLGLRLCTVRSRGFLLEADTGCRSVTSRM